MKTKIPVKILHMALNDILYDDLFISKLEKSKAGFLVQAGGHRVKPEIAKAIFIGTTGVRPLVVLPLPGFV